MRNVCDNCGGRGSVPSASPYAFWRRELCSSCGGDGFAKPPGWPDRVKMKQIKSAVLENYLKARRVVP